ncbi:hypothetical protein FQZ97_722630 [compost metagenome]
MVYGFRRHAAFLQSPLDDFGYDPTDAFIANPAFLSVVIDVPPGLAEMINEINVQCSLTQYLGDHAFTTNQQCCRAVAVVELLGTGRSGPTIVGRGQQNVPRRTGRTGQRLRQACQRCALRTGDVSGGCKLVQVQRLRHYSGIQTLGERQAARGEQQLAHASLTILTAQRITRCGNRHGDAVFIPIGHGPMPFALALQLGGIPGIGFHDCLPAQAQARDVSAESGDTDAHSELLMSDPVPFQEGANVFNGFTCLWQFICELLEHVNHFRPDIQLHLATSLSGLCGE